MKNLFSLIFLLITAATVRSELLLFDYFKLKCDGEEVVEKYSSFAEAAALGEWTKSSSSTGTTSSPVMINMEGGRLTYANYIASGEGNVMQIDYSRQATATSGVRRGTALCYRTSAPSRNEVVYTAFLVDLSAHPNVTTQQEIFAYTMSGAVDRGRIFFKHSSSSSSVNVLFGLKANNESSINAWTGNVSATSPILIVVKYIKGLFGDTFEMWVNPDPKRSEAEQTGKQTAVASDSQNLRFASFVMENKRQMKIGAIRVATTFEEAIKPSNVGVVYPSDENPVIVWVNRNTLFFSDAFSGDVSIMDLGGVPLQESRMEQERSLRSFLGSGIFLVQTRSSEGAVQNYKVYFDE